MYSEPQSRLRAPERPLSKGDCPRSRGLHLKAPGFCEEEKINYYFNNEAKPAENPLREWLDDVMAGRGDMRTLTTRPTPPALLFILRKMIRLPGHTLGN